MTMKNLYFSVKTIILVVFMGVGFVSCGDDNEEEKDGSASIVGTWVCDFHVETDYIICFKADGTGYDYFTEDGLDEDDYFSYKVRGDKITLYYHDSDDDVTIEYDLSSDGKQLTLYGMDDNDMAVLHFTRRK